VDAHEVALAVHVQLADPLEVRAELLVALERGHLGGSTK
jgi:hypothetical protein